MNILVDAIILIVLLLCVWGGHKNGFIKSFFGLFGSVAAFILSSILANPIGRWLGEKFIFPIMEKYLLTALSARIGTTVENLDFSALPASCDDILSRFGFSSESVKELLVAKGDTLGENMLESVSNYVIQPISDTVGFAIAYIALFIVLSIAIRLAVKALNLVAKLPVLNFSNKTLGLLMGVVWGLFLSLVLSGAFSYLEPALQGNKIQFVNEFDVEKTYLVRTLSKIDLLGFFAIK